MTTWLLDPKKCQRAADAFFVAAVAVAFAPAVILLGAICIWLMS